MHDTYDTYDAYTTVVKLLDAVSEGVRFRLTGAYDMKGHLNWGIKPRVLSEDMIVFSRGNNGYYEINDKRYPLRRGRDCNLYYNVVNL